MRIIFFALVLSLALTSFSALAFADSTPKKPNCDEFDYLFDFVVSDACAWFDKPSGKWAQCIEDHYDLYGYVVNKNWYWSEDCPGNNCPLYGKACEL